MEIYRKGGISTSSKSSADAIAENGITGDSRICKGPKTQNYQQPLKKLAIKVEKWRLVKSPLVVFYY